MRVAKNTSYKKYVFGDFDRDGAKNIDDPKPFDRKVREAPNTPGYWHRAQFVGGEVKLSDELLAYEAYGNSHRKALGKVLRENPHSQGRIKTVPSMMRKVRERYIEKVGDVAGARILTKDRAQAYATEKRVHERFETQRRSRDDFYKKPKNDVYYGLHNTLVVGGKKVELQIQSKPMSALNKQMHPDYKSGKSLNKYATMARRLFRKGF